MADGEATRRGGARVAGSVRDYKVGPYLGTGPTLITDAKKTKYVYKRYLAHSARTKVNRLHIFNLVDLTINKIYFLPTLTSRTATGC